MSRNRFYLPLLAAALLLLALPAAASDGVIRNGIDVWHTVSGTFANFRSQPIPAGFLCAGSSAFAGKVPMRGVPIVTRNPGDLAGADTVVLRLDDAPFNAQGIAQTPIQFKAMHLASVVLPEPLRPTMATTLPTGTCSVIPSRMAGASAPP